MQLITVFQTWNFIEKEAKISFYSFSFILYLIFVFNFNFF